MADRCVFSTTRLVAALNLHLHLLLFVSAPAYASPLPTYQGLETAAGREFYNLALASRRLDIPTPDAVASREAGWSPESRRSRKTPRQLRALKTLGPVGDGAGAATVPDFEPLQNYLTSPRYGISSLWENYYGAYGEYSWYARRNVDGTEDDRWRGESGRELNPQFGVVEERRAFNPRRQTRIPTTGVAKNRQATHRKRTLRRQLHTGIFPRPMSSISKHAVGKVMVRVVERLLDSLSSTIELSGSAIA